MAPVITSPRSLARDAIPNSFDHHMRSSPFATARRQSEPLSTWSSRTMIARSAAAVAPRSPSSQHHHNNHYYRDLTPRLDDNADIVPETYGAPSGPNAGTVVGIVLGSVGGFLLLLWLIYSIANLGNGPPAVLETASVGGTESVVTRKSRRRQNRSHRRGSASVRDRRETVEVRRTERVVPVPPVTTERIIVEERSRSRQPMPGPPPPAPPPPMAPPPRVVHDDSDDEVVVIEENSPPRRRDSRHHHRRQSSRRSSERRRSSGYRDIDPYRFAGGDASIRSVSRRRSYSRDR
ncbi:hypothetical protein PFICI_04605 [Pestalotiopsis fici W106-1]|uniref:Uncharacterized protein n=1 Tax=Pestalotiopsis fici (strain W106-1 / CGMCC3.15140) TaxID=1229662 RepID=W3X9P0_PESFW|nr:uncharacterized protein PFICI_04605 [Pestalotiopsis fici W106-1]ETS82729.1 hypothetical protein PFICI_04605 [Pestalotiopsis fici W106-1]